MHYFDIFHINITLIMKFFVPLQCESKRIIINYPFHDVGNNRFENMDTAKVINVLDVIVEKLRKTQCIDKTQFEMCLSGELSDVIHSDLEDLVVDLFDEHTRVTKLINDVYDLRNTLSNFEFLVK